jgi:glyceraldehyde 3-phosphate dehydrogenase
MTTVHAYRSSQRMVDGPAKGFAHGLASVANLVQMFRGAAQTTTKAVPGLGGRFDGEAIPAPAAVGSIAGVVFAAGKLTIRNEVVDIFR